MEEAWLNGLAGGLLIGAAASLYLLMNGRIAGMTGILADVLFWRGGERSLGSAAFLGGALGGAVALVWVAGTPAMTISTNVVALVISGLIVGVGVSFGNGCTSGHGVCGMSRLSLRSILATLTFMATTALTVAVLRHGLEITL